MHPEYDALVRLIAVLCTLLVILLAYGFLTKPPCGHTECHVLCEKLSHADRVRLVTKQHASHRPAYPARDCTECRPVDPGG